MAIVGALLAFMILGVLAYTTYRRNASRNLAAVVHRMQAVAVASAAIAEVAEARILERTFADDGARNRLKDAFTGGHFVGGTLLPGAMDVQVPAETVARLNAGDTSLTLAPVKVRVVSYRPGLRLNQGVIRFTTTVEKSVAGRTTTVTVAEDYAFRMFERGPDALGFLLTPAPLRRVTT